MSIFIKACLWVEKTQGYLGEFNLTCYINYLLEGKQDQITLTTFGSSGVATLVNNVLNIPQYGGIISISYLSGENINSHTPVAVINNLAYKLDASNPLHQFAFVGFTEASSVTGQPCFIKQIGEIYLFGWGLIPNQQYLAGVNGTIITDNVSVSNFTKIIGYATSSNTLQIIKDSVTINKL